MAEPQEAPKKRPVLDYVKSIPSKLVQPFKREAVPTREEEMQRIAEKQAALAQYQKELQIGRAHV